MKRTILGIALLIAACSTDVATNNPAGEPFGDTAILERMEKYPNVIVIAPRELLDSTFTIDGATDQHRLWPCDVLNDCRLENCQETYGRCFARARLRLSAGGHVIVISKSEYVAIRKRFVASADTPVTVVVRWDELVRR